MTGVRCLAMFILLVNRFREFDTQQRPKGWILDDVLPLLKSCEHGLDRTGYILIVGLGCFDGIRPAICVGCAVSFNTPMNIASKLLC